MHDGPVDEQIRDSGLLSVPDETWAPAVRRAEVIGPLARAESIGLGAVDAAAAELGVSRRQVYVLVGRWRAVAGLVSYVIPGQSSGGRGRERLPDEVESVVRDVLRKQYLTRQKKTTASVHREITRVCRARGLAAPSRGRSYRRSDRRRRATPTADRPPVRDGRDRRVPPRDRGPGPHPGGALGAVGRAVPGAHGHRQAGLARAARRGGRVGR